MAPEDVVIVEGVRRAGGAPVEVTTTPGPPGAPDLVLVHGSRPVQDHAVLAARLAERFTVHRYAREETGSGARYALADDVALLLGVLRVTGSRLVLGHGLGGLVALLAAGGTLTPCVDRVAAYDAVLPLDGSVPEEALEQAARALATGETDLALAHLDRHLRPTPLARSRAGRSQRVQRLLGGMLARTDWGRSTAARLPQVLAETRAGLGMDSPPDAYAAFPVPALLVVGSRSPAHFASAARELDAASPLVSTSTAGGCGHDALVRGSRAALAPLVPFLAGDTLF